MSLVIANMHLRECWVVAHEQHVNEGMKNSSKEVPDSLFIEIKHKKGWFFQYYIETLNFKIYYHSQIIRLTFNAFHRSLTDMNSILFFINKFNPPSNTLFHAFDKDFILTALKLS